MYPPAAHSANLVMDGLRQIGGRLRTKESNNTKARVVVPVVRGVVVPASRAAVIGVVVPSPATQHPTRLRSAPLKRDAAEQRPAKSP